MSKFDTKACAVDAEWLLQILFKNFEHIMIQNRCFDETELKFLSLMDFDTLQSPISHLQSLVVVFSHGAVSKNADD